jgi:formate dehydrogenase gamma subunit
MTGIQADGERVERTMRTGIGQALLVTLAALCAGLPAAAQQAADPIDLSACASCHPAANLRHPLESRHGQDESCLTCHHVGFSNDPEEIHASRLEACTSCHVAAASPLSPLPGADRVHGDLGVDVESPACTACHSVHVPADMDRTGFRRSVDASCAVCHEAANPLHGTIAAPDMGVSDEAGCTDCHTVHGREGVTDSCLTCHEDGLGRHASPAWERPECGACHTIHGADPVAFDEALVDGTCVECHEDLIPAHAPAEEGEPGCTACHEMHPDTPGERMSLTVSKNCTVCHQDEGNAFMAGGHARSLEEGAGLDERAPDCVACHGGHAEPHASGSTRIEVTARCVACHSDDLIAEAFELPPLAAESYLKDFHGQTAQFIYRHPEGRNLPDVMVCSDCHGAHEVKWVAAEEVEAVCVDCHEKAGLRIATAWIGHDRVGPRNATLVWLARVFYWFLIPFSLGGLLVNIALHLNSARRGGARMGESEGFRRILARLKRSPRPRPKTVQRFTTLERLEHFGSMSTFILLVVTGLPQIYHRSDFALAIIRFFGGIQMTRYIHRTVGVIMIILMLAHLLRAVTRAVRRRRLPIMVPTRQDFRDTLQTVRHHLFGEAHPRFGKFDFGQKYEYWGLLLGGSLMSVTGLVLLFPDLLSHVLPGTLLAVAKVVHGLEGTFAVLVIVIWHSWGVIFRPEIFPLDTGIFTGKMTVDRLKHEHPLEYERIFGVTLPREEPGGVGAGEAPLTGDGEGPLPSPG